MKVLHTQKQSIAILWVAMLFLFSCVNDVKEVQKVSAVEAQRTPMEVQKNIEYVYTDSARVTLRLTAPLAENYSQLEEPYLEFTEGLLVIFYNDEEQEDSRLSANHGIRYPNQQMWTVKGNVEVSNKEGEKLNTEHLVWDVKEEKIYSEDFVKITSGGTITTGEGFEANQDLSDYEIKNTTGIIKIEEDGKDDENR